MDGAAVLDGVARGLQLGLLAAGLSLLYGLAGVLNLAHGSIAVAAAIVTANVAAADGAGLPMGGAAAIGVGVAAGLALVQDRAVLGVAHRRDGDQRVLLSLLLSLGTALVIDGVLEWRYPSGALSIRIGGGPVDVLGVPMRRGALVAGAVALGATALLVLFLRRTTTGRAVRSLIEDERGARLVGVDPVRMRRLVVALSGALAGLVAVTSAMNAPLDVRAGFSLTVLALVVAVVGGLGDPAGALVAGLLLGVVETIGAATIGASWTTLLLLGAAALTIVLRPRGVLAVST